MLQLMALLECYNTYDQTDIYFDVSRSILENYTNLPLASLQEFADSLHVSVSTANRFIRQLYYENFTEFRAQYNKKDECYQYDGRYYPPYPHKEQSFAEYIDILTLHLQQTANTLRDAPIQQLLELIEESEEVVFTGIPMSSEIWRLQTELVLLQKKTSAFADPNYQKNAVLSVTDKSLVINVVFMRVESTHGEDMLRLAKQHGAKTACIAHVTTPAFHRYSDCCLLYESTGTYLDAFTLFTILHYMGDRLRKKLTARL